MFGINAWRVAGMWCQKFDLVRIGRGSGHISEGIQSGGDELVAHLHIVIIFWFCLGGFWLSVVHAEVSDGLGSHVRFNVTSHLMEFQM